MTGKKNHEHLKYLQYEFIYILNGTKFFFMAPNQRTIKQRTIENTAELVLLINQVREPSLEKAR